MFTGCLFTIKVYILLELYTQKILKEPNDEVLEKLDTYVWLAAFEDQKILSTTKNYLETCYERSTT